MQRIDPTILVAVALISGGSMAYELLLLRLFSLMYWDHFAHLIISMALLGFGVSGTVLALLQHRLLPSFHRSFFLSALLFSMTLLSATSMAGRIGFNPPEVIWNGGQLARLAVVFIISTVPFLCAGLCIGLTMRWKTEFVARIYQADLIGAACGALLIMSLLFLLPPQDGLRAAAFIGCAAAVPVSHQVGDKKQVRIGRFALAIVTLLIMIWPARWLAPVMSPFKSLSQTLLIPGVNIATQTSSPTGYFTAVTSAIIPFRSAPGLSLRAPVTPPEQVALFHDGHSAGVIHGSSNGSTPMEFMRWTPMALPYILLEHPRVLVLGAGGGGDAWHALIEEAAHIDVVEQHREILDFVVAPYSTFTGSIYDRDIVNLYHGDIRGFLAAAHTRYDLIQLSPFGTATPPATQGHALNAQYFYTVEGMHLALKRLTEGGILNITMPFDLPPRTSVKMMMTMSKALKLCGTADPFLHMAVIRSWNTVTIAASRSPFSVEQLAEIRRFCRSRAFDLVWLPDITPAEVNRINVLDHPFFYKAALEISTGKGIPQSTLFNLVPATDDRPWFSHFFRWSSFSAIWAQRAFGSAAMLEWDYLLLWMSLIIALMVSLVMIIAPLRPLYRKQRFTEQGTSGHFVRATYFAALGLAFFFLEIAFIQRFMLFLSQPMITLAVIVPSFLLFAGCGSGAAKWLAGRTAATNLRLLRDRPMLVATTGIVIVSSMYLWLLPPIFRICSSWPDELRILISILLIGGLAFWMGMPFPLGLKRLAHNRPDFIPLAWGVNGLFSVISTIVATVLALHAGFRAVIILALGLYLLAAAIERRL